MHNLCFNYTDEADSEISTSCLRTLLQRSINGKQPNVIVIIYNATSRDNEKLPCNFDTCYHSQRFRHSSENALRKKTEPSAWNVLMLCCKWAKVVKLTPAFQQFSSINQDHSKSVTANVYVCIDILCYCNIIIVRLFIRKHSEFIKWATTSAVS